MKRRGLCLLAIVAIILMEASFFVFEQKEKQNASIRIDAMTYIGKQVISVDGETLAPAAILVKNSYGEEVALEEEHLASNVRKDLKPIEITTGILDQNAQWTWRLLDKDKNEVFSGDPQEFVQQVFDNGTYLLEITLNYSGQQAVNEEPMSYEGENTYRISLTYDIPTGFTLSRDHIIQGGTMALQGYGIHGEVKARVVETGDVVPVFVDERGQAKGLVSTTFRISPGDYTCKVEWEGGEETFPFTVEPVEYAVQHLTISSSTVSSSVGSSGAMEKYNRMMEETAKVWTPVRYYDDAFTKPLEGRITSEFGLYRYTNGSANPSRHVGIDIAADEGTPIPSAASGQVLVADWFDATGYSVVLDHGFGVRTYYYHLSALDCEEGQMVQEGDIIGKVGSTGYATGPHLHFNVMVGENSVDPWSTFDGTSGIFDLDA